MITYQWNQKLHTNDGKSGYFQFFRDEKEGSKILLTYAPVAKKNVIRQSYFVVAPNEIKTS